MQQLINKLPEELVSRIKEYVLSTELLLKLFYQKHNLTENKLKNKLSSFTSKQLEEINWKYLYYKIYKTSPPRYDNNNLVPIFNELPNPPIYTLFSLDEDDFDYEPLVIYNPNAGVFHYQLNCITRSDYYPENVRTQTEKSRKKQQYKNIINSWKCIHEGNIISETKPTIYPITHKIHQYLLNMEYELIRAIFIMAQTQQTNPTNQKNVK
jgi:hypothetical protein